MNKRKKPNQNQTKTKTTKVKPYPDIWRSANGLFSASLSRFPAPREIIHNYDFERKKGIVIFYKILLSTEFVNTLTPTTIY